MLLEQLNRTNTIQYHGRIGHNEVIYTYTTKKYGHISNLCIKYCSQKYSISYLDEWIQEPVALLHRTPRLGFVQFLFHSKGLCSFKSLQCSHYNVGYGDGCGERVVPGKHTSDYLRGYADGQLACHSNRSIKMDNIHLSHYFINWINIQRLMLDVYMSIQYIVY